MTTSPSSVRQELLHQHELIREMMHRCRELIEVVETEPARVAELVTVVARLRWAVTSHNRLEEELLTPLLKEADGFGDQRVTHMGITHHEEHAQIGHRLDTPTLDSLRQTLRVLDEHIQHEEKTFLSSRVLRDDVVTLEDLG